MVNITQRQLDDLGANSLLSEVMSSHMQMWESMYTDSDPHEVDANKKKFTTLQLPSEIASELARLAMLEFKLEDATNGSQWEFIREQIDTTLYNLKEPLELGMAVGGMFLKPYISADGVAVNIIMQNDVIVTSVNDRGEIVGVIFTDTIERGDMVYTRLEYHEYINGVGIIKNIAYESGDKSNPAEKRIPLHVVEEWSALSDEVRLSDLTAPLFGYYKVALGNTIDTDSPLGVSVYSRAVDLIRDANSQYRGLKWEFEAKEAAVYISDDAIKTDINADGTITKHIPQGKERLFITVSDTRLNSETMVEPYSPSIRETSIITGLNEILMKVENKCGLSRGTLSNDKISESYTNELELKLSRNRVEACVHDNQNNVRVAIMGLITAVDTLARLYKLSNKPLELSHSAISFGDSLITDEASRLESMRQDVNDGLLPKWVYIKSKYGLNEDDAKKLADETASKDPLDTLY